MNVIKVDFLQFKKFWIVRVYGGMAKGDYLQPTLEDCQRLVEVFNYFGK